MKRQIAIFLAGLLSGVALLAVGLRLGGRGDGKPPAGTGSGHQEADLGEPPTDAGSLAESDAESDATYPYAITGRVVDERGEPVVGAHLVAFGPDAEGAAGDALTDAQGAFRIADLALGLYRVEARAQGFSPASRGRVVPDGPALHLELEATADLVGRATLDEQPIDGLSVLVGGPGIFPSRRTVTQGGGRFTVDGLTRGGMVEVLVLGDEIGSGFGHLGIAGETTQLDVPLERAPPLNLELIDDVSGQPVGRAVIRLSGSAVHVLALSEICEEGACQVRGLPPGELYLQVRAPGFLPWAGEVQHAGERLRIPLSQGGVVSGRVIDADGRPVASAQVYAEVRDTAGWRWRPAEPVLERIDRGLRADGSPVWPDPMVTTTDGEGRFRVSGLPAGQVRLTAESRGFGRRTTDFLDTDGASVQEGIEIRLQRED